MRYHRCKCGYREAWESGMTPSRCDVCPKCGSTLAESPSQHLPPEPHDYITRYDQNTGKPYEWCRKCHQSREEIEAPTNAEKEKS